MPRTELDKTVVPSLLDRLTDEAPKQPADAPITGEESIRRYRLAVQRDVEQLLNTRRTIVPVSSAFREVRNSVHEYGLPDILSIVPGSTEGRKQLVQNIRDTITRFEPRLSGVQVKLAEHDQARAPQVRFIIEGSLRMESSFEQVAFDTVFDIASGIIDIEANR